MRSWACFLILLVVTSCTHAPSQRSPAATCEANGRPLDMEQIRNSALEAIDQYRGIQAYILNSFAPRMQKEIAESQVNTCSSFYRMQDVRIDLDMSLAYLRSKQNAAAGAGLRIADPRLIESMACMKPLADELRPEFNRVSEGFNDVAGLLEKVRQQIREFPLIRCMARPEKSLKHILPSLVQTSGNTSGSGFFVEAGGQKYLITAAHVSHVGLTSPEQTMEIHIGGANSVEQERMDLAPGEFNAALDISSKKTSRRTPALKIASAQELVSLEVGHKFYAVGFPVSRGDQVVALPCMFEGFAPGQRKSREAQMLLYCPGRSRAVGISGGPLIDEQGRVWGMNSSEAAYSGALLVTPVLEARGQLQVGIQDVFVSPACYERNLMSPRTCQVMPNMFESQVP